MKAVNKDLREKYPYTTAKLSQDIFNVSVYTYTGLNSSNFELKSFLFVSYNIYLSSRQLFNVNILYKAQLLKMQLVKFQGLYV